MPDCALNGLLFVGDPHLSPRAPGFRKDDYAESILGKLKWCIEYARDQKLLTILLGDLFHHPRDISNRLLVELLSLFSDGVWAIAGNHDCSENALSDNDSLAVLAAADCVRLLDRDGPWHGTIQGATVVVGGTAWGQPLPESFDLSIYRQPDVPTFTFWAAHHDVRFPGGEDVGRFDCRDIPGIDVLINGHIHRTLPEVKSGGTTWFNPGNISRVSRSDATRKHMPRALQFDISQEGWCARHVDVPHQPFDDVFHPLVEGETIEIGESTFIRELAALEGARTAGGAGLQAFLDANLPQFPDDVAKEIRLLSQEVLDHAR